MNTPSAKQTMTVAHQKVILWSLVLLCGGEIVRKPQIADALWTFCAVGLVPGTHTTLAPNTVMAMAGGCFGLGGLLLAVRRLSKRRRREQTAQTPSVMPAAEQPLAPARHATVKPQLIRQPLIRTTTFSRQPKAKRSYVLPLSRLVIRTSRLLSRTAWLGRSLRYASRYSQSAWRALRSLVASGWRLGYAAIWQSSRQLKRVARAVWRWLVPELRRFDSWLEVQTHALIARAAKKLQRHENLQLALHITRECKAMFAAMRNDIHTTLRKIFPGSKQTAAKSEQP